MAFAQTVTTTHTKTLISPSTGSADKVYGSDYVSATSHTATVAYTGMVSGGVLYGTSTTGVDSSALLTQRSPILGGGAGAAPYTDSGFTATGTGSTYVATILGGLIVGATNETIALRPGANATYLYSSGNTSLNIRFGAGEYYWITTSQITMRSDGGIGWSSNTDPIRSPSSCLSYGGAENSVRFAVLTTGIATSRTEINKAVTAFTDGVAKTVFTLTIPNAAHSASYLVRLTGSIGAGGAIGANEASATNCYVVTLTRTAGVNAVGAISAAFGAAAANVAGATTVTCTGALAAVSGAVGAVNTIDIQATITKGGGASDNHTIVATASLLNANATGITIA